MSSSEVSFKVIHFSNDNLPLEFVPLKGTGKLVVGKSSPEVLIFFFGGRRLAKIDFLRNGRICNIVHVESVKTKAFSDMPKHELTKVVENRRLNQRAFNQLGRFPMQYLFEELVRHGVRKFRADDLFPKGNKLIQQYTRKGFVRRPIIDKLFGEYAYKVTPKGFKQATGLGARVSVSNRRTT